MTVIILLYGVMMFASSYVEEEHHFWYWTASAWFFYLFVDRYDLLCSIMAKYAIPLFLTRPVSVKVPPTCAFY